MTEYAFPGDLLDAIQTRWQTAADQQFELPEDRILQRLLQDGKVKADRGRLMFWDGLLD